MRVEENRDCTGIQVDLPAYREGWLAPDRARVVGGHLASCPRCREFAARDEQLVRSLQGLPRTDPVPVDWAAIAPLSRRKPPVRLGPVLPASGLALAAAALALLILRPLHGIHTAPTMNTPGAPAASSEVGPFVVAHIGISAGAMDSDPNRSMLMQVAPGRSRTP